VCVSAVRCVALLIVHSLCSTPTWRRPATVRPFTACTPTARRFTACLPASNPITQRSLARLSICLSRSIRLSICQFACYVCQMRMRYATISSVIGTSLSIVSVACMHSRVGLHYGLQNVGKIRIIATRRSSEAARFNRVQSCW